MASIGNYKHGGYVEYKWEYNSWRAMRERCNNKKYRAYHRYGGRGIKVCDEWSDFSNFLHDMGKKPTREHELDRVDNDGNYEPSNCRWATKIEQRNNMSSNNRVEIDGITKTVSQWCKHYGIGISVPYNRIRYGWGMIDAITMPVNKSGKTIRNGQAYRKKARPECKLCGRVTKNYRSVYCSHNCYVSARFHSG